MEKNRFKIYTLDNHRKKNLCWVPKISQLYESCETFQICVGICIEFGSCEIDISYMSSKILTNLLSLGWGQKSQHMDRFTPAW